MYIEQFFLEGLGCISYLVGCEAHGEAVVIDPDRDVGKYVEAAGKKNLKITHVVETHLHADHVSGNTELAALTGATIHLHRDAEAQFPHQGLQDGDILEVGNIALKVQHTPGHTPESITLLLQDKTRSEEYWMAFTGDTLFVGDAGRPDLIGEATAPVLAEKLYQSLFGKLANLPDGLLMYPGHGAGSLCGKSIGSVRSSTLGFEKQFNPVFALKDKTEFVESMTHNLPEQPGNHTYIKKLNKTGPRPLGQIAPRPLSLKEAISLLTRGAAAVDVRPRSEFVKKHIAGSVHLPFGEQVSKRVGYLLQPREKIVLILEGEHQYREAVLALARVGFEQVLGYLSGGIDTWERSGYPLRSGDIQDLNSEDLFAMLDNGSQAVVVDVRERWEYVRGHIPQAKLIPLGQLHRQIDTLDPEQEVVLVCATGNRSQSAAALFGQKGFKKIYNAAEGMVGWMQRGYPIREGEV